MLGYFIACVCHVSFGMFEADCDLIYESKLRLTSIGQFSLPLLPHIYIYMESVAVLAQVQQS
jgi:hypothetical protein